MAAFLLSWNPEKYFWKSLRKDIVRIRRKGYLTGRWSCGNRADLPKGSEFFLVRLGPALKGLVGRGVTASLPYEDKHWDPDKRRQKIKALYVKVRFTDLNEAPVISWEVLQQRPLSRFNWSSIATGVALPEVIVGELHRRWADAKHPAESTSHAAESPSDAHRPPAASADHEATNALAPVTLDWIEDAAIESHPFARELKEEIALLRETGLSSADKQALIVARRGQGAFRDKILAVEPCCRVTRVKDPDHLNARHIKPWNEASNLERLSESNGLMLAPHIAHLFAEGFISFADNGDILVSPQCPRAVLAAWGVATPLNVGPFQIGQRPYLRYHRDYCFKT
jgi:hypothetical protein